MAIITNREMQAFAIDVGIGVAGFILSILWGKVSRTKMTQGTIRMLAFVWLGITAFGILAVFVMRRVP